MLLLTLSLLGCSLALRQCFKARTPLAQRPIILMLLQLLATAQWSSWLLALTFVLLAHMLLALPLAVAASAPSWQLDTSTWSDGMHLACCRFLRRPSWGFCPSMRSHECGRGFGRGCCPSPRSRERG